ncbi:hypothetical protein [Streptomyces malaysiensis]|uniref:hypothetical protein n=1 Tax=Streptomyces malaysiensis TaxID=92644 RepID=UPI002B2F5CB5|nr:hypothetical protein R8789_20395 [Streptomyces malaysiensis]
MDADIPASYPRAELHSARISYAHNGIGYGLGHDQARVVDDALVQQVVEAGAHEASCHVGWKQAQPREFGAAGASSWTARR